MDSHYESNYLGTYKSLYGMTYNEKMSSLYS